MAGRRDEVQTFNAEAKRIMDMIAADPVEQAKLQLAVNVAARSSSAPESKSLIFVVSPDIRKARIILQPVSTNQRPRLPRCFD